MDKNQVQEEIVKIFFEYTNQDINLNDDIFYTGVIDSFDLIRLLEKMQNTFNINEFTQEINYENFSSLTKITDFILLEIEG